MPHDSKVGCRVIATIKSVKGQCKPWHKVGDQMELSGHKTAGLCGFFYQEAFPYLIMLQFGGGFPVSWECPDVVELESMDRTNGVRMELEGSKNKNRIIIHRIRHRREAYR